MSNQPTKMWSGRFREPLHPIFESWQASFRFDVRLLKQEIDASKAHARGIAAAGILSGDELATMRQAASISSAAHIRAMRATQPGKMEYEIEAELLHEFRKSGAQAMIDDGALQNPTPSAVLGLHVTSSITSGMRSRAPCSLSWLERLEIIPPGICHMSTAGSTAVKALS